MDGFDIRQQARRGKRVLRLPECLGATEAQAEHPVLRIVVDTTSADKTASSVRSRRPAVIQIQKPQHDCGVTCNLPLSMIKTNAVVLATPDVVLNTADGFFANLLAVLENEGVAAA